MASFIRLASVICSKKVTASVPQCIRSFRANQHILSNNNTFSRNAVYGLINPNTTRKFSNRSEYVPKSHDTLQDNLQRLEGEIHKHGSLHSMRLKSVVNGITHKDEVTGTQAQLLIRCFGSVLVEDKPSDRIKAVTELWKNLTKLGVTLDISHYNALLRVYNDNQHQFSPTEFLTMMDEQNIVPDRLTFKYLVIKYSQMGDIESISKIIEHMKAKEMPVSPAIFEAIMLAHSRNGDLNSAEEVFSLMKSTGHKPTEETYLALAMAQAEHGDMEGISKTMQLAADEDRALKDLQLMEIVFSLATSGHKQHVPQMIAKMSGGNIFYNRCVKLFILRLCHDAHYDTADQLFATMHAPEVDHNPEMRLGIFYLRQMIKSGRPLPEVLAAAKEMPNSGHYTLESLLETAVLHNRDQVDPLMSAMQTEGRPIRAHYFRPLIIPATREGVDSVIAVLRKMRDYGIQGMELKDSVLPYLVDRFPDAELLDMLSHQAGFQFSQAINVLCKHFLDENQMSRCVSMLESNPGVKAHETMLNHLINAAVVDKDYQSAAVILAQMWEKGSYKQDEDSGPVDNVGKYLRILVERSQRNNYPLDVAALVEPLHRRGLSISLESEQLLLPVLAQESDEVKAMLKEMAAGTMSKVEIPKGSGDYSSPPGEGRVTNQRTIAELEFLLAEKEKQGDEESVLKLGSVLLKNYCIHQEVAKAEAMYTKLEECGGLPTSAGTLISMLSMYINEGELAKALKTVERITTTVSPDTAIDRIKVMKLAGLMVKEGRLQEALDTLEREGCKYEYVEREESASTEVKGREAHRLLQSVARTGNADMVREFTNALLHHNFAKASVRILHSSVSVHLMSSGGAPTEQEGQQSATELLGESGDLKKAFNAFCVVATEHKMFPLKGVLLRRLIRTEDTQKIQDVIDLIGKSYGESKALLDLMIAFLEEGKVKQAANVMQTPGLHLNALDIKYHLDDAMYLNKTDFLEKLVDVTKYLYNINRTPFFLTLLEAYDRAGNHSAALDLWPTMQEQNVTATDEFLFKLATLLEKHGRPVPFSKPLYKPEPPKTSEIEAKTPATRTIISVPKTPQVKKPKNSPTPPRPDDLGPLLEKHSIDEVAKMMRDSIEQGNPITFNDRSFSLFIYKFLEDNRCKEPLEITSLLMAADKRHQQRLLKMRVGMKMLAAAGREGLYEPLKAIFDAQQDKRSLTFACMKAGHTEEQFLEMMERQKSMDWFSSYGIAGALCRTPSLLPKVEEYANEAPQHTAAFNEALWSFHFVENNEDKLDQLGLASVPLRCVLAVARFCDGIMDTLAPRLLSHPKLSTGDKAEVYGRWVESLYIEGKTAEAKNVLDLCLSKMSLADFIGDRPGILVVLKRACETKNIPFQYEIPPKGQKQKKASSSSSSSSSDSN